MIDCLKFLDKEAKINCKPELFKFVLLSLSVRTSVCVVCMYIFVCMISRYDIILFIYSENIFM